MAERECGFSVCAQQGYTQREHRPRNQSDREPPLKSARSLNYTSHYPSKVPEAERVNRLWKESNGEGFRDANDNNNSQYCIIEHCGPRTGRSMFHVLLHLIFPRPWERAPVVTATFQTRRFGRRLRHFPKFPWLGRSGPRPYHGQ